MIEVKERSDLSTIICVIYKRLSVLEPKAILREGVNAIVDYDHAVIIKLLNSLISPSYPYLAVIEVG